jgi:hypothetical protein
MGLGFTFDNVLYRLSDKSEFIVHEVSFVTYSVEDMTNTQIVPGKSINRIYLRGANGRVYESIVDAVTDYIRDPFSMNPGDWAFDNGKITVDALSSTIATDYADNRRFVRTPTQNGIALWEQGKKELYLVRCEVTLGMLSPITPDIAQSEGISI